MPRAHRLRPRLALAALALSGACATAPERPAPSAPAPAPSAGRPEGDPVVASLPGPERWRAHLANELLPFWTRPEALGEPLGNFPTFRCLDGRAYRPEAPCPGFEAAPPWVARELDAEYTRMKSRQAFAYGVGFHVTGDPTLLAYARAGVDYLRRHAYERDTGSAVTYWRAGRPGPPPPQRTAQDLAYAQLGLAFYYYLTRDPDVLADLVRLKDHVFGSYYEPSTGLVRWVLEAGEAGRPEQRELVALLDQINAYLLLVAPLLDEPARGRWLGDLGRLARALVDRFYAPEQGLFWGAIHEPERRRLGSNNTDFGHSIKALWMVLLVGELVGDAALVAFAREHAPRLLARAAQPSGCWASGVGPSGELDRGSVWWASAELDQAAATLALRDRALARYLPGAYACWFERFVDREGHEVWPFVSAEWPNDLGRPRRVPKAFHWKNGYHSTEHALVALLTTAGLQRRPVELHYAFRRAPERDRIRPYLFRGTIAASSPEPLPASPEFAGLSGLRVTFRDLR
ncbi:MAG TPA: hypothetical protein VFS43_17090 [Polyangiaceae bacterium]|nr:hypothetical protein [Polyangiaceae bacterium]